MQDNVFDETISFDRVQLLEQMNGLFHLMCRRDSDVVEVEEIDIS